MLHGYLNRSRTLENGFSQEVFAIGSANFISFSTGIPGTSALINCRIFNLSSYFFQVCDDFQIGFPYYWEDFAAISDSEELVYRSASKGISPTDTESDSDAYKTPAQEARGSNLMSGNATNDAKLTEEASTAKKKTTSPNRAGGPLTRSRARFLSTGRR